jgi:hypothetical protein
LFVDTDGLLRGELVNPLPFELSDCIVLFENWVYRLDSRRGVMTPGAPMRIEIERAMNLQWRLSGRRPVHQDDVSTPWDRQSLDVPRILEMMMFHASAGGESYTQLTNYYQSSIDLSHHLRIGRAILVGRARAAATKVMLNGDSAPVEARNSTFFRVVFPVEPQRD